jgi:hypothetical protein
MTQLDVDLDAVNRFPFGTVRDYPIFPLSVTDAQTVLAVSDNLEEHQKNALDFILCTKIEYKIVSQAELDVARRTYYGIGVTCSRCPFCGSSEIVELIWNIVFDGDLPNERYELADNYIVGRGRVDDQQNDDPRWRCRSCNARWGWRQIESQPRQ